MMCMDNGVRSRSFFFTSTNPDITHKSPAERCHQHIHTCISVLKLLPTMNMVNREGTVVLIGGCECHGAPHNGLCAGVQKQGL